VPLARQLSIAASPKLLPEQHEGFVVADLQIGAVVGPAFRSGPSSPFSASPRLCAKNLCFSPQSLSVLVFNGCPNMNGVRSYSRLVCPKGTLSAWRGGGRKLVSFIGNLSLGGVYLRTLDPPSPGTTLQLLLDLPSGQVRARGLVEWNIERRGMGVKFIAMQHEDRGRLSRWLKTQAA